MKWYKDDPVRFELEKGLINEYHRGVQMFIQNGKVRIEFSIRTTRTTYHLVGHFPDKFPYKPMEFYVKKPRLKRSSPHRYGDGMLCLHTSNDVGPQTTAKVYIDWAKQWVATYEKWLKTGKWPAKNQ